MPKTQEPKKKKGPGGRPTKYSAKFHPILVKSLARQGLSERQIAKQLGIAEQTLLNWKHKYEAFLGALKAGKIEPDRKVEISLFERAVGYSHKEDKIMQYEGVPIIVPTLKHYPPEVSAIKYWLNNRMPEKWKEHFLIEHAGEMKIKADITLIERMRQAAKKEKKNG